MTFIDWLSAFIVWLSYWFTVLKARKHVSTNAVPTTLGMSHQIGHVLGSTVQTLSLQFAAFEERQLVLYQSLYPFTRFLTRFLTGAVLRFEHEDSMRFCNLACSQECRIRAFVHVNDVFGYAIHRYEMKDAPVAPGGALLRTLYAILGKSTIDKGTMTDILGGSESFMQFRSGLVNLPMQIVQDNNKQPKGVLKCLSPLGAVDEPFKILLQGNGPAEDDHVDLTDVIIANSGLPQAQKHPGSQPSSIALLR